MKREEAAFRFVVFYEAAALASRGRIPPWTHFLMRLSPAGRVCVSIVAGVWMLRHLEAFPFGNQRSQHG